MTLEPLKSLTGEGWSVLISVGAALSYGLVLVERPPSLARTIVKCAAVGDLAVAAYLSGVQIALLAALIISTIGDGFLADPSPRRLPWGLGAFAIAHLCYIDLFAEDGGGRLALLAEPWRNLGVSGAMAGAVAMLLWLWSRLGALRPAVAAYAVALGVMTALAFTLPRQLWPVSVGAVSFMASDALLSAELFKNLRTRWSSGAVWWLYYAAQASILWGYLR